MILLLYIISFPSLNAEITPPHCMKTSSINGQHSKGDGPLNSNVMHFAMGLHSTVCFRMKDADGKSSESLLHTVTFEGLEHHHAVTKEYNFAIPLMHKECFCECKSTERCNAKSHAFTTCPGEYTGGCYRTLFSLQSNTSCASSSQLGSNLCCELSFKPYENKTYMAFKLEEHPIAFATFKYAAYDYTGNTWIIENNTSISIPLNGRSQKKMFGAHDLLEIDVSGTISRQLNGGLYFTQLDTSGKMNGIRHEQINKFTENNPNNLGWFRQNESNGHFYISKWRSILKNVFDARVENCIAQEYTYSFDAEFYALDEMPIDFTLPPYVEEQHHWIERATFSNESMEQIVVSYKEGTNLDVGLYASNSTAGNLFFLHNSSHIDSFNGSIIFDAQSRHYLNIFVHGASGILHGRILSSDSDESPEIYSFTIYVHEFAPTNRSFIVRLPAIVEKKGMFVCIKADEMLKDVCEYLPYEEQAFEVNVEKNSLHKVEGDCKDCNKVKRASFWDNINPLKLLDLLKLEPLDSGDFVAKVRDVIMLVIGAIILYLIVANFIVPICQCCICPLLVAKMTRPPEEPRYRSKRKNRVFDEEYV